MTRKEKHRPRKHRSPIVEEIKKDTDPLAAARSRKKLILAHKIAEAIDKLGLKRIEVARRMGKDPSEVTRWTSGDHNFTVEILSDLEEVLGVQLLPVHKIADKKLHEGLECNLTVHVQSETNCKVSRQDLARLSSYISWNGGMQVTEIKTFSK